MKTTTKINRADVSARVLWNAKRHTNAASNFMGHVAAVRAGLALFRCTAGARPQRLERGGRDVCLQP